MKKIILLLLLSLFELSLSSQNLVWAESIGSIYSDYPDQVKLDAAGNVYTTGTFRGLTDFDPGSGTYTLVPPGVISSLNVNIFISKLDASGNFLWAKQIGARRGGYMAFDASGNVYLTGIFSGTVDCDPGPAVYNLTTSANSGFICKLDPSGNFVWAENTVDAVMTLDAAGNIYLAGSLQGTADFDPGAGTYTLASSGTSDAFVYKLDASGNFLWARTFDGGNAIIAGECIALDAAGNIYAAGSFSQTVDFDPGAGVANLNSPNGNTTFITKLDASGNFVWVKQMGGELMNSIAIGPGGNICTTGAFASGDFDPGAGTFYLSQYGNLDIFVSNLDASGNFLWAKSIGSNLYDLGRAIIDTWGNVYVTGNFSASGVFGPGPAAFTLTADPNSYSDVFICKIDPLGNYVWTENFEGTGGINDVRGLSIAVDAGGGNIYITGIFDAPSLDFDPGPGTTSIATMGNSDIFICKYGLCLTPTITASPASTLICEGTAGTLSVTSNGIVNWFSSPTSTLSLGGGHLLNFPVLSIGTYSYYVAASTCTTSTSRVSVILTVDACTGIKENDNNIKIVLFPNPAKDEVEIQLSAETNETARIIFIYNNLGQLVDEQELIFKDKKTWLSTMQLPDGIYVLSMHAVSNKDGNGNYTGKLVVAH